MTRFATLMRLGQFLLFSTRTKDDEFIAKVLDIELVSGGRD